MTDSHNPLSQEITRIYQRASSSGWDSWTPDQRGGVLASVVLIFLMLSGFILYVYIHQRKGYSRSTTRDIENQRVTMMSNGPKWNRMHNRQQKAPSRDDGDRHYCERRRSQGVTVKRLGAGEVPMMTGALLPERDATRGYMYMPTSTRRKRADRRDTVSSLWPIEQEGRNIRKHSSHYTTGRNVKGRATHGHGPSGNGRNHRYLKEREYSTGKTTRKLRGFRYHARENDSMSTTDSEEERERQIEEYNRERRRRSHYRRPESMVTTHHKHARRRSV